MTPTVPLLLGFSLILFRTSALLMAAPIFGSKTLPARIKIGISLVIALVAFVAAGLPAVAVPPDFGALALLAIGESAVGLTAGLTARLAIDSAQYGAQAASLGMGLGYGHLVNPNSGAESSVVGELYAALALAFAMTLGLHREAIAWLVRSVQDVPPGALTDFASLAQAVIRQTIYALTLAIRIAYPLFAATLLGYGVLGLLGKASPQLSLSNLGFAVTLMAGGGAIYLLAPDGARIAAHAALQVFSRSS